MARTFTEEDVGFVYRITEIDTGMMYYGIKRIWKTVKLKPLKGRKNKRHKTKESDWKTYKTSSPIMQQKLTDNPENYRCQILLVCSSKTELKAYEAYYQLTHYVNGEWNLLYNSMINLRLNIR